MMDLRTLVFVEVLITDVHTGETLKHSRSERVMWR